MIAVRSQAWMVWGLVLVVCVLARGDDGWTAVKTDSGSAGNDARSKYLEFSYEAKTTTRFRWEVQASEGRGTKPYFRLKLERQVKRNSDTVWQNVGPICTVHASGSGAESMGIPAGQYRVTVYFEDVKYTVAIESK